MQIETFWQHWRVTENPFRAEEARDDPVYRRLMAHQTTHPDFEKVYGEPDRPSSAVVFGEKGSGKTALRLLIDDRLRDHNEHHSDRRVWVVRYDDLNPVFDRFSHSLNGGRQSAEQLLEQFRLVDHQDAMLSQAVTHLVDRLLGVNETKAFDREEIKAIRRLPRERRVDLGVLAILYDQPRSGSIADRWSQLRRVLRLGWLPMMRAAKWLGILLAVAALVVWIVGQIGQPLATLHWVIIGVCGASAIGLLGYWAVRNLRLWWLGRKIRQEMRVVERDVAHLRRAFSDLRRSDLTGQPLPLPGDQDSRYQLTARLIDGLAPLGYRGMIVLVDRVDEPAMINGDAKKMRSVVWPMFNNKFLQQDRVGLKLLLPIELRHLLHREDPEFYQRARLDKQHMIDRLVWSGTTLYDLCSRRLQACRPDDAEPISVRELFEDDVTRQDVIDALDQMQQPRDAFKFVYNLIQEHCATVPEETPAFKVPRLALQQARKIQAQRVQDLGRGLAPA